MEDLLPFVERELGILGDYFRRFAAEYPAVAGALGLQSDHGGDPDIRRLTQAAAVLNARTAKKLDDDYPELTSSFLDMLAPHLLRPFPSCSIARFDGDGGKAGSVIATIPRGTLLKTAERHRGGLICKFKTVYPVTLAPVTICSAKFLSRIDAPPGIRVAPDVTADIALTVEWEAGPAGSPRLPIDKLRLMVDGDASFCAAVLDALFLRTVNVFVETGKDRWLALEKTPLAPVGLLDEESLLPLSAKTQSGLRLLSEYFCFPAKFNFLDIDLPR